MNVCVDCLTRFLGLGDRCNICRHRFEKHGPKVALKEGIPSRPGRVDEKESENGVSDVQTELMKMKVALLKMPDAPTPGEVCPTCGHRRAMTGAERVRRHRARRRFGDA